MCGISGFTWENADLCEKMVSTLKHRGPDDHGIYVDSAISLGNSRLAILDLSKAGHQPMVDGEGNVLIFNGEIYNHFALREKYLQNENFSSTSDTETILKLFSKLGLNAINYFEGMFAFAYYNQKNNLFYLARDRLGIKPLYYTFLKKQLAFSSELKALLLLDNTFHISERYLHNYLAFNYFPGLRTPIIEIKKLNAGSILKYNLKSRSWTTTSYWSLPLIPLHKDYNLLTATTEVDELLSQAVSKRLLSDRKLGIALSGGIDSNTILWYVSQKTDNIDTFSVYFEVESEDEEKFNSDAKLAKKMASTFNSNHHELLYRSKDVIGDTETMYYHLDEPINNLTTFSSRFLYKQASKKVKVLLGGDGGDELFGGYPRYTLDHKIRSIQRIPKLLLQPLSLFSNKLKKINLNRNIADLYSITAARNLNFLDRSKNNIAQEYNPSSVISEAISEMKISINPDKPPKNKNFKLSTMDFMFWLREESLLRTDRVSMSEGDEATQRFLDYRLVEYVMNLPNKLSYPKNEPKLLLKNVMKDRLPGFILKGKKKGFFTPVAKWIRTEFGEFLFDKVNMILSDYPEVNWISSQKFSKMYQEHCNFQKYWANELFGIFSTLEWYKHVNENSTHLPILTD